jgi:type VI secretion system protein ImpA
MGFDLTVLDQPVDGGDPCGPDLDVVGDPDFTGFMATVEGQMPGSYFSFDAGSLDVESILGEATTLLRRTRDVRLMVLLSKVLILSRDVAGFVGMIDGIRQLFEQHWDTVKPLPEDGDHAFRLAPLYNLDDVGSLVFPLQFAPLASAPRVGTVTYRAHLLATGAANAREEEANDPALLERALTECDLDELVAARDQLRTLGAAISGIERVIIEQIGYDSIIHLERLPDVVKGMIAFLDASVARRDPAQAMGATEPEPEPEETLGDGEEAAAPIRTGSINSQHDAAAALDAALAYYRRCEPSSAAIPLIEQARASVGLSLGEVMAMLLPEHAGLARINVGAEPSFKVQVRPASGGPNGAAETSFAPVADVRAQATALLEQVALYYRQAEPSSPIPLLIERARSLASRDFLSLLKDLLPEEALKTLKIGG